MHETINRRSLIGWFIFFLLIAVAGSCSSQRTPKPEGVVEYMLRGRVESIDFDKQRLTVAHEKIDGYMDAMTMPFPVKEAAVLKDLKSGDRIEARLVVDHTKNMKWLEKIEVESKKE